MCGKKPDSEPELLTEDDIATTLKQEISDLSGFTRYCRIDLRRTTRDRALLSRAARGLCQSLRGWTVRNTPIIFTESRRTQE